MNVVLLEKVTNLGNIGDQVKVRAGYGRNFLIPHGKAVQATKENVEYFESKRAEIEQKASENLSAAQARAEQLATMSIEIASKAGDEGKLYGSIGNRDIADAVTAAGVKLGKSEVQLADGPLRNVGEFDVQVRLHTDVSCNIKINVVPE